MVLLTRILPPDSVDIPFLSSGRHAGFRDGWVHTKRVPHAIIVQPLIGRYTVLCEGETVSAHRGETVLVPANARVTFVHHGTPGTPMASRWVHINWRLFRSTDITSLLLMPLKIGGASSARFGEMIAALLEIDAESGTGNILRLACRNELGFGLLRAVLQVSRVRDGAGEIIRRSLGLQKVISYMEEHLQETHTIADLARTQCLSPSRFYGAFKNGTGLSPMHYLRALRVAEACRLLVSSDKPIKQISAHTGFANQFHFSRVFKNSVGLSPMQYRKNAV